MAARKHYYLGKNLFVIHGNFQNKMGWKGDISIVKLSIACEIYFQHFSSYEDKFRPASLTLKLFCEGTECKSIWNFMCANDRQLPPLHITFDLSVSGYHHLHVQTYLLAYFFDIKSDANVEQTFGSQNHDMMSKMWCGGDKARTIAYAKMKRTMGMKKFQVIWIANWVWRIFMKLFYQRKMWKKFEMIF